MLEGCDGTGKTTQSKRLAESGILGPCTTMVFPDRSTPIGHLIDQYLKREVNFPPQAVHLLYTANRWEMCSRIEETLKSGTSIVCDRYLYSGAAYSIANGLDWEWCLAPEKGVVEPDMVILIDIEPKTLLSRKGFGDERYEKLEFQTRVRNAFLGLMDEKWVKIDGSVSLDDVTERIHSLVKEFIAKGAKVQM